jgi:hypothetical protein
MGRRRRSVWAGIGAGALLLALVVQGSATAADPLRITRPVRITNDPNPTRTYGSPFILIDPSDRNNVVAATVEMRSRQCVIFRSGDGGQTWRQMDALPTLQSYPFCFHVSGSVTESPMAWGRDGRIYLALAGWDVADGGDARGNLSVIVARSDDLGTSWRPVLARDTRGKTGAETETNRPVSGIAVDSRSGPDDIVYVTWRRNLSSATPAAPARPMVAVSTDGGRTFGEPFDVMEEWARNPANITGGFPDDRKNPENVAGFNPVVAADDKGGAYVLWERRSAGVTPSPPFAYYVSVTRNQGRTWEVFEAFPETPNLAGGFIVWSRHGGPDGTLHAIWHAKPGQTQGETDIYHRRSTDGGHTWSEPKLLNDDDPSQLHTQLLPSLSIAPNGRVDAAWWDFRDDPGTYSNDVYSSYSTDNGVTWSANVRVTDRSINRKIGPWSNGFDMRQPVGIASTNQYTLFAWDDTRLGDEVGQAQDMFSAAVQFSAVGSGTSNAAQFTLAALAGVAAVGLILLGVAAARRDRTPGAPRAPSEPAQSLEVS